MYKYNWLLHIGAASNYNWRVLGAMLAKASCTTEKSEMRGTAIAAQYQILL